MLPPSKVPAALYALHLVLVKARVLSEARAEGGQIARLLDGAEGLPSLITRRTDEDTTEEFRDLLAGLGEEFPDCTGLLANFDRGVSWDTVAEHVS